LRTSDKSWFRTTEMLEVKKKQGKLKKKTVINYRKQGKSSHLTFFEDLRNKIE